MMRIEVPFYVARIGKRTVLASSPAAPMSPEKKSPRIARMLALAHALRAALDGAPVGGLAALSAATKLTPERVTQLVDLTFLAPDIQERLVFDELPITAKTLQPITLMRPWALQREAFERLLATRRSSMT